MYVNTAVCSPAALAVLVQQYECPVQSQMVCRRPPRGSLFRAESSSEGTKWVHSQHTTHRTKHKPNNCAVISTTELRFLLGMWPIPSSTVCAAVIPTSMRHCRGNRSRWKGPRRKGHTPADIHTHKPNRSRRGETMTQMECTPLTEMHQVAR